MTDKNIRVSQKQDLLSKYFSVCVLKSGGGAAVGAGDSNVKRENVELKRRIRELEAELKRAGKAASGGAGATGDTAAVDVSVCVSVAPTTCAKAQ